MANKTEKSGSAFTDDERAAIEGDTPARSKALTVAQQGNKEEGRRGRGSPDREDRAGLEDGDRQARRARREVVAGRYLRLAPEALVRDARRTTSTAS